MRHGTLYGRHPIGWGASSAYLISAPSTQRARASGLRLGGDPRNSHGTNDAHADPRLINCWLHECSDNFIVSACRLNAFCAATWRGICEPGCAILFNGLSGLLKLIERLAEICELSYRVLRHRQLHANKQGVAATIAPSCREEAFSAAAAATLRNGDDGNRFRARRA